MKQTKRLAVRTLYVDGQAYRQQVLELQGDTLLRHYPLTQELPHTIWLPTTLYIENNKLTERKP